MSTREEAVATDLPRPRRGRLVVCPTPIGNLGDVTLRVLDTLREADVIACEDTRRTRVLLDRYTLKGPSGAHPERHQHPERHTGEGAGRQAGERSLVSYHEHNEPARARELVRHIQEGEVIALVSDAGMPLVSDPGWALLQECLLADVPVEVLPGPSSVLTALVASGLPAERWSFVGFLPRKRSELERVLGGSRETLVAFESPGRLAATLGVLAALDRKRPVAVCRELTKLHEEVRRGSAAELAAHYAESPPRGEIVLVAGSAQGSADREEALAALRALVDAGARARPAATVVAKLTGVGANDLYGALVAPD
ncbi:MAG TPA: 16S rRNA (cytidine(1402)-2'-O)-methyltransferase [Solirubrobacteraceae bacterium]|jgi:16S rRNA (cytidine1402-2'-O)-methyltransferase|nr:16S rRNA (cytidine(1402)-2'-O)-methyltransferase [Solirubrobacteraceae bacterium]